MLFSQFTAVSAVALLALATYVPEPFVASDPLPAPQPGMPGPGGGAFWGPRHRVFMRVLPCPLRERLRLRFQVTIHQYQLEALAMAIHHVGLKKRQGQALRDHYRKQLKMRTKLYLERMRKIRREWRKIFLSYHKQPVVDNGYDDGDQPPPPPQNDYSQAAFAKYVMEVQKDPARRKRFRTRWEEKIKELDNKVKYEPNLCAFNNKLRKLSNGYICPGKIEDVREEVALQKAGD